MFFLDILQRFVFDKKTLNPYKLNLNRSSTTTCRTTVTVLRTFQNVKNQMRKLTIAFFQNAMLEVINPNNFYVQDGLLELMLLWIRYAFQFWPSMKENYLFLIIFHWWRDRDSWRFCFWTINFTSAYEWKRARPIADLPKSNQTSSLSRIQIEEASRTGNQLQRKYHVKMRMNAE